jgi:threonine/homoserine/homoserine lactone efflux protein
MPDTTTVLLFAAATLALVAIPGPNLLYIASRSVAHGPRAGCASALGVEAGTLVHIGAATVGLSALIASSATAFSALKYLGAAYLLYLGARTLISRRGAAGTPAPAAAPLTRAFAQGMLVNVLNPKVALFFLAFLPQFVDPDRGPVWMQVLVLGAILGAFGFAMDCLYAVVSAAAAGRLRGRGGGKVTGGVYLVLGAAAALTGGRH